MANPAHDLPQEEGSPQCVVHLLSHVTEQSLSQPVEHPIGKQPPKHDPAEHGPLLQ